MEKTYGCNDCRFLSSDGRRCTMWEVKVPDPHEYSCEIIQSSYGRKNKDNQKQEERK